MDGTLEAYDGPRLAQRTLNNASLIAARIYRTRLELFDRLYLHAGNDVRQAVRALAGAIEAAHGSDPYSVLEDLVGGS